ncbi:Two-component system sensor kinase [Streptomyces venezuelae]|uniref:sensor histidine kinase n=1 Tax=Streptomyces gardneri TaxID=66892 RepID=UPI0006BC3BE5|nr:histidine kinase [Streptomyces gardneri]ALO13164.1 Two-component system sensor kinase [Streptomyces venezuelae]QPK49830.1 sensor histidine kinase [Streptomyces gardneri]WRK41395.1 histidine kinase [Streptomyces venezuelae]CUM36158.1 Hemoglobin, heme-dependent two component system sensory histidine kinase ChrS [Streptomyces venezuelae]
MSATPSAPFLKRVTPGGWAALAWLAGLLFTGLLRLRMPGQSEADVLPGVILLRWDGVTTLLIATAIALRGSALLTRRPAAALRFLLVAAVVACVPLGVDAIPFAQYLAVDVALYVIAVVRPPREAVRALLLALGLLAGYLAFRLLRGWVVGTTTELAVAMTAVVVWLLGRSEHQSRTYAESSRAQAAAQAVTAERLRIAREMHDTVAHSIGIVALQAGAARRVIDTQPEGARQALAEIETASRETLAGLRRMLGALRTADRTDAAATTDGTGADGKGSDGKGSDDTLAGTPADRLAQPSGLPEAPGLSALDRLAEVTGAAGVRVTVRRIGAPCSLPPDIDLSAFRLVQESVTNVVRHSGADACTVTVDHRDPVAVAVTVEDRGPAAGRERERPGGGSGYGLAGMRERVALLHGEFAAGPRPGGGFRVTARLPLPTGTGATTR